jgi:hypothetical protein
VRDDLTLVIVYRYVSRQVHGTYSFYEKRTLITNCEHTSVLWVIIVIYKVGINMPKKALRGFVKVISQ